MDSDDIITSELGRHRKPRGSHAGAIGRSALRPLCNKELANRSNLNRHIRDVHEKRKAFKCGICSKPFSDRGALGAHLKGPHKVNKEVARAKAKNTKPDAPK